MSQSSQLSLVDAVIPQGDVELLNCDCLDGLRALKDKSVNMVFTSPPYNMNLRVRNGKYCSRNIPKEPISSKYTNFDDNLSMEDYFAFNRDVLRECLRVSELVFYNVQFITGNKRALFELIGEFSAQIKEFIVWDKGHAQPAVRDKVLNSGFEVILVLESENAMSRRFDKANFDRGALDNVWRINRGRAPKDHKAVFPVPLVERAVRNFSNPGDIILDPFMGTGTTGLVSRALGRRFIGMEIDEGYFKAAVARVYGES